MSQAHDIGQSCMSPILGEVEAELHEEGVLDPAVAMKMKVDEVVMDRFCAMGFFETIWMEYVRYGPGPLKSHTTWP